MSDQTEKTVYTFHEWLVEAVRRFGEDKLDWWFVCLVCGVEFNLLCYLESGASPDEVSPVGCIEHHGGHGNVNPIDVDGARVLAFGSPRKPCLGCGDNTRLDDLDEFGRCPGCEAEAANESASEQEASL